MFNESERFAREGKKELSMKYLMAYLTIKPNDIDALIGMIKAFFEIGETRNAIAFLNRAVKLDPKNPSLTEFLEFVDSGFH